MKRILPFVVSGCILAFAACNNQSKNLTREETQKKLFAEHHATVLHLVDSLFTEDQNIRHQIDSVEQDIARLKALNRSQSEEELATLTQKRDSLLQTMVTMSTNNTERVIELIDKYGYPSTARLKDYKGKAVNPMALIGHADLHYKNELLAQLKTELKLNRLDTNGYEYMKWHLNGRKGIPNLKDVKITVTDSNGKTQTFLNE